MSDTTVLSGKGLDLNPPPIRIELEWISVNTRLPTGQGDYIVWIDCPRCRRNEKHSHNCLATGYTRHGIDKFYWDGTGWPNFCRTPNLTHWLDVSPPICEFETKAPYARTTRISRDYAILDDDSMFTLKQSKPKEQ